MKANTQQKKAIDHDKGPCVVTASPGSGKTSVLTQRATRLYRAGNKKILCLTFTNKAAEEMKTRIAKSLDLESSPFAVCTFHALCGVVLRKFGKSIGYNPGLTILDSDDQKTFVKKVLRSIVDDKKAQKDIDIKKIVYHLNSSRESCESFEEMSERFESQFDDDIYWEIAKTYLEELVKNNCIDFSGMLYSTIGMLEKNPSILKVIQSKWDYIQVDECQDTNYSQFKFIDLISEKHNNVFLTGDVDQSVYLFRNARYQNILDFIEKHNNCTTIKLGQNYRSTPEIVKVASTLIKHNKSHMGIDFYTENPSGVSPQVIASVSSQEEAKNIATMIHNDINFRGYKPQEIAVLYRMNSLSIDLQLALSNFGINFSVIGGGNYFQLKEIKDGIAMLKFLLNPNDSLSFHRCADLITGVGPNTIGKLEKLSKEKEITIMDAAKLIKSGELKSIDKRSKIFADQVVKLWDNNFTDKSPDYILVEMLNRFSYDKYLEKNFKQAYNKKRDNLQSLANHAASYSKSTGADLTRWLNAIMLTSDSDKESKENCVNLMTLHACKGLEFPVVYMAGVESKILPHARALSEAKDANAAAELLEEERRICYVGMTRAEERLIVSYCHKRMKRDKTGFLKEEKSGPSRFIKESGLI